MLVQFLIGFGLIFGTVIVSALAIIGLETALERSRSWLVRPPHRPKMALLLGISMLWTMLMITCAVWIWALGLWVLDIFQTLEAALYFALVAFTTLGFGDILLPNEWRLLSGIAAANGLLNFGLLTAVLIETLRGIRMDQRAGLES